MRLVAILCLVSVYALHAMEVSGMEEGREMGAPRRTREAWPELSGSADPTSSATAIDVELARRMEKRERQRHSREGCLASRRNQVLCAGGGVAVLVAFAFGLSMLLFEEGSSPTPAIGTTPTLPDLMMQLAGNMTG